MATAADVEKWRGEAAAKARLRANLSVGKTFVVDAPITLPPGLFGAQRCDFPLPANVPQPKGPKARCHFYYLKDHTYE